MKATFNLKASGEDRFVFHFIQVAVNLMWADFSLYILIPTKSLSSFPGESLSTKYLYPIHHQKAERINVRVNVYLFILKTSPCHDHWVSGP
jgi:hypothetical protein